MSDMTSTEKKRRLILFSLLGVALAVPILLASFFLFAPGKTARHGQTDFGKNGRHYRQGGTHENAARPSYPSQQAGIGCSGKTAGVFRGNQYVFPATTPKHSLWKNRSQQGHTPHGF